MSDDDSHADSSYGENDDGMDIIDEISMFEYHSSFGSDERENGKYYIGCYYYTEDCFLDEHAYDTQKLENGPKIFFGESITAATFFRYRFREIVSYLDYSNYHMNIVTNIYENSFMPLAEGPAGFEKSFKVHILQIDIQPILIPPDLIVDQYLCVLKTHWISLVQRHWKRIFLARKKYVEYYRNPGHLWKRELGGRELGGRGPKISGLRGMLSCYSTK